jgi:multisubunit Na+/H+ antiporter MnhE subunit
MWVVFHDTTSVHWEQMLLGTVCAAWLLSPMRHVSVSGAAPGDGAGCGQMQPYLAAAADVTRAAILCVLVW